MKITVYFHNKRCDLEMWFVTSIGILNNAIVNAKACAHSPIKKLMSIYI